jgi:predicted transcriptional regulator
MRETLVTLTSDIVGAHVSNNEVAIDDVPVLIEAVFGALAGLSAGRAGPGRPEPAVPIGASVQRDHVVCLDCGRKMKVLKRHLSTDHDMSTKEYRERWGLRADHPLVAPNYAAKRRTLAKEIGLGRKPGQKRGRKKKA